MENIHYLDLINTLVKQKGLKQQDLADMLKVNTRQYRRIVKRGLTMDELNTILTALNVQLLAQIVQKDHIITYKLGQ